MKKTVFIMRNVVLFSVLLLLSVIFVGRGIYNHYRVQNCIPLTELSIENGKEGILVRGEIDSYVVRKIGSDYKGACMTTSLGGKEYDVYLIPVAENSYITVMISDHDMKKQLENFQQGVGTGVYFEGELVDYIGPVNEQWLQNVVTEEFSTDKLISVYTLKQVQFESKEQVVLLGFVCMFLAVLYYMVIGSVRRNIIVEETAK